MIIYTVLRARSNIIPMLFIVTAVVVVFLLLLFVIFETYFDHVCLHVHLTFHQSFHVSFWRVISFWINQLNSRAVLGSPSQCCCLQKSQTFCSKYQGTRLFCLWTIVQKKFLQVTRSNAHLYCSLIWIWNVILY